MPKYSLTNMMRRAAKANRSKGRASAHDLRRFHMFGWKPGPTDRKVTPSMSKRQRLPTADKGAHMVTKRKRAGGVSGMKSWYPGKHVKK